MDLKQFIREVPDFPSPGILFRDITPLLAAPAAFRHVIECFAQHYQDSQVDVVAGIEARGFLFASPLAFRLGTGVIPVRKEGKLPLQSLRVEYSLEYGTSAVEMHADGIAPGQRVLLVDDLLATGGTLQATTRLVEMAGGQVAGIALVIELRGLEGRKRLRGYDVFSLIDYEGA